MNDLKNHIQKILTYSKNRILEFIDNAGNCCQLKNFNFAAADMINYNDAKLQYLYILRYYAAYLCEYRSVYHRVLKFLHNSKIAVFSVGAGCMVDLDALSYALYDMKMHRNNVEYSGIDISDWKFKAIVKDINNSFIIGNLSNLKPGRISHNVIMFSKSIVDIEERDFSLFIEYLSNSTFLSEKLVLVSVISPRDNEYYLKKSKDRFDRMANILSNKGYCTDDNSEIICPNLNSNQSWMSIYPDFYIPRHIISFTSDLSSYCPVRRKNGFPCDDKCDSILNRFPLMKADNFKYQMLKMEKKNISHFEFSLEPKKESSSKIFEMEISIIQLKQQNNLLKQNLVTAEEHLQDIENEHKIQLTKLMRVSNEYAIERNQLEEIVAKLKKEKKMLKRLLQKKESLIEQYITELKELRESQDGKLL